MLVGNHVIPAVLKDDIFLDTWSDQKVFDHIFFLLNKRVLGTGGGCV